MARLELSEGNQPKARELAQSARRVLGGYFEEFFPSSFLHLLELQPSLSPAAGGNEAFLENYLEMIESLYPSENRTDILNKVLTETSRMLSAERSGLFWFPDGLQTSKPELRAASNLSLSEVTSSDFRPAHDLVTIAQQTREPQVKTITIKETPLGKKVVRSVLCIPIEVQGRIPGVLYYDTSYMDNAFEFIDLSLAKRLASHTNRVVEQRFNHLKILEQVNVLTSENILRQETGKNQIITQSSKMMRLLEQTAQIAGTESTVLLTGETGTGKELVAKYIHDKSARSSGPFVVVDSTTIPENLLESELFGHEKGAFTGADNRKIGRIEIANQGTLFLDEVGELTLPAQAKLLRALQEKTFYRVGGTRTLRSDFRLIAATNRDLIREVAQHSFREDLYYRLNVVPIHLPPLRERDKDPVLLARHFMSLYSRKYDRLLLELTPEDEKLLSAYGWPGNIRELENMIERGVILSQGNRLELNFPVQRDRSAVDPFSDRPSLDEIQRRYIRFIIAQSGGKISGPGGAAEILGMKRTSLYTRMKALGIKKFHL
jgi:transcriptional regulator with GAF, ATPase, and Fis domain